MTSKILTTKCGRTVSTKGKPFTHATLRQHEQDCPQCNPGARKVHRRRHDPKEDGLDDDILDMIDDDLPDGAYWAMYNELEGNI